jgi:hypothetical protein
VSAWPPGPGVAEPQAIATRIASDATASLMSSLMSTPWRTFGNDRNQKYPASVLIRDGMRTVRTYNRGDGEEMAA